MRNTIDRMRCRLQSAMGSLLVIGCSAVPACAHHVMDGETPRTFVEGLLSGLAHPVIGPDHLAFIVAIGIIAAMAGRSLLLIAAFIASSLSGVVVHADGIDLPLGETLIALSLMAGGVLIWTSRARPAWVWTGLAIAAGLVHGHAYGEAVVGADRTPLTAYLIGLTAMQASIAIAAYVSARRFEVMPAFRQAWLPRAGIVLALMGAALLALGYPTS